MANSAKPLHYNLKVTTENPLLQREGNHSKDVEWGGGESYSDVVSAIWTKPCENVPGGRRTQCDAVIAGKQLMGP